MPAPQRGFTLVELLVVVSIIAILSVIGITIFSSAQKSARDARRRGDLKAISNALEQYKAANGTYPSSGRSGITPWFCAQYGGNRYWDLDPILSAALQPYFSGPLPTDPINNDYYRYFLDMSQETYYIYVNLEVPPPSPWPTKPGDGCGTGPSQILMKNQQ